MTRFLLLLALVASAPALLAQTGTLTGRVLDSSTQEPLPGATVLLTGTSLGAATDLTGRFTLPAVPVDAYTVRIFTRHGWVDPEADYHDLQAYFEDCLETDVQLFNEFHALIVRVGKEFCKPTPKCEKCPLHDMLPEGGPIEMDG